jgi:hypothetical protein
LHHNIHSEQRTVHETALGDLISCKRLLACSRTYCTDCTFIPIPIISTHPNSCRNSYPLFCLSA